MSSTKFVRRLLVYVFVRRVYGAVIGKKERRRRRVVEIIKCDAFVAAQSRRMSVILKAERRSSVFMMQMHRLVAMKVVYVGNWLCKVGILNGSD